MNINLQFRDESLASTDFEAILTRINGVVQVLATKNPTLETWYAQGDSLDEAYLYQAFDHGQPSRALLAVFQWIIRLIS